MYTQSTIRECAEGGTKASNTKPSPLVHNGEVWEQRLLSETVGTYSQAAKWSDRTKYRRATAETNFFGGEITLSLVTYNF